jgi:putative DNA primase/helicase
MEYVLGSYASPIQVETVFENPFSDKSQNELFTMIGKRLAIANEAQSSYRLKASFIKAISGEDRQKAKGLYKDAMAMTIKFKLVLQCNERPFIDSSDKALCSRVKLIEFPNRISDAKRDINLTEKLKAEGSGILNWFLEGVQRYYQNQIEEPPSVRNATNAYLADNDMLARFLGDYTIGRPGSYVFCNEFYNAYKRFCQEEGDHQLLTQNKLGRLMTERGYAMDKRSGRRAYIGIEFVPEGDAAERAYGERFNGTSLPFP